MSSLVNKLVGDESSACENAPAPAAAANKEPTQKMISQMRQALEPKVDSQLRQGGEEGCTDDCLRRWLTEHKLDAQAAARALTEHATWRIEHVPNGFISDEEVAPHLQQCKVFLPGTGNQGHAILLLRSKLHQPSDDIETLKKFMIYTFDAALGAADPAKNPGRLMLGVMDLRDIGMGNLDLEGLVTAFKIAQRQYPQRLGVLFLYEAPAIFSGLWKAVQPFVDEDTRKRVQFISEENGSAEVLRELCAAEVLPTDLGGTCQEPQPIEKAVARLK